jgi:hypothetical protein
MRRIRFRGGPFRAAVLAVSVVAMVASTAAPASARDRAASRLRHAAAATAAEGSARMSGTATVTVGDTTLKIAIDGVQQFPHDGAGADASMKITYTDAPPPLDGLTIESLVKDGTVYLALGPVLEAAGRELPPSLDGIKWAEVTTADGSGAQTGLTAGSSDPSGALDQLLGITNGSVEKIGPDTVRGAPATHYRASVNVRRAIARAPQSEQDEVRDALAALPAEFPVDVWIDADGRLVRESLDLDFKVSGQSVSESVVQELYDFGTPVHVEAPPPEQTTKLDRFLKVLSTPSGALA